MTEYPAAVETTGKAALAYDLVDERRAGEIEGLYRFPALSNALSVRRAGFGAPRSGRGDRSPGAKVD